MVEAALEQLKRVPIPIEWRGFKWENNENFEGPMEPLLAVGKIVQVKPRKEPNELDRLCGRVLHDLYFDLVRIPKYSLLMRPNWPDAYSLGCHLRLQAGKIIDKILLRRHLEKKVRKGTMSGENAEQLRSHLLQCWFYEIRLFEAELMFHLNRNPAVDTAHLASQVVPFEAERVVDGTRIAVSEKTRIDGLYLARPTILEVKTGGELIEDQLQVAGYALSYESETNIPVDLGAISYIRMRRDGLAPQIDCRIFPIGITLRSQFIERRNTKMLEGET